MVEIWVVTNYNIWACHAFSHQFTGKETSIMALENIEAPLPGKIISVTVKPGDKISEFGEICVIEAMKMENPIVATVTGEVKELPVKAGQIVKAGELIAVIEY